MVVKMTSCGRSCASCACSSPTLVLFRVLACSRKFSVVSLGDSLPSRDRRAFRSASFCRCRGIVIQRQPQSTKPSIIIPVRRRGHSLYRAERNHLCSECSRQVSKPLKAASRARELFDITLRWELLFCTTEACVVALERKSTEGSSTKRPVPYSPKRSRSIQTATLRP